jgi:transcriptional regulator with XRE-family HTH domain
MTMNGSVSDRTPLSVLLFYQAMQKGLSISDYAKHLDIGAISLRQFIEGTTQRPRQKTLDLIGRDQGLSSDEVRRRMAFAPEAAPSFGEWLNVRMKGGGFSRARLTRETGISDGALRNYLANNTMPDSDQAQKLAEVLGADPMDIARVIVAQTVREAGGAVAEPGQAAEAPAAEAPAAEAPAAEAPAATVTGSTPDENALLNLWRQLHPQGRRATFSYIAMLLAER